MSKVCKRKKKTIPQDSCILIKLSTIILEPLEGNWGNWTAFSECSHSCGGGIQYRIRGCDNPLPAHGGDWCTGNDTETQECNMQPCPGNDC